jgi:hypothetical protein
MSAPKFFYHDDRLLGTGCGKQTPFESVWRAAIVRLQRAGNIALTTYEAGRRTVASIGGGASID